MRLMQDIRSLIIAGHGYNDIIQQLHLEPRTFYRYLNAVFEDDRRLMAETTDDTEFLNQMAIARDRLLEQRRDLLEMAHDSSIDPSDRIAAHHLIAEIAAAILRIYEGGPAILSQRHAFPKTALTAPGTTGLKLVLNNNNNNDNDNDKKPTAMKETSRLQYEEAMKRVEQEKGQQGGRV
jgi:AraC-like DNA-binding protein